MTDEEMAEEWVKAQMVHCIQEQVPYFDFAMQAYLAGLKASKTKWHKVADGDFWEVRKCSSLTKTRKKRQVRNIQFLANGTKSTLHATVV